MQPHHEGELRLISERLRLRKMRGIQVTRPDAPDPTRDRLLRRADEILDQAWLHEKYEARDVA